MVVMTSERISAMLLHQGCSEHILYGHRSSLSFFLSSEERVADYSRAHNAQFPFALNLWELVEKLVL